MKMQIIVTSLLRKMSYQKLKLTVLMRTNLTLMQIKQEDYNSTMLGIQVSLMHFKLREALEKILVKLVTYAASPTSKRTIGPSLDLIILFSSGWASIIKSSSIRQITWITSMKKRNGTKLTFSLIGMKNRLLSLSMAFLLRKLPSIVLTETIS